MTKFSKSWLLLVSAFLLGVPLLGQGLGVNPSASLKFGECSNTGTAVVADCAAGTCLLLCLDPCSPIVYTADCFPVRSERCTFSIGTGDANLCRECTCLGICFDDGLYATGTKSVTRCWNG